MLLAGLFLFGLVIVASSLVLLVTADLQIRSWATTSLTSLLTAFVAYLLGRQQSK